MISCEFTLPHVNVDAEHGTILDFTWYNITWVLGFLWYKLMDCVRNLLNNVWYVTARSMPQYPTLDSIICDGSVQVLCNELY